MTLSGDLRTRLYRKQELFPLSNAATGFDVPVEVVNVPKLVSTLPEVAGGCHPHRLSLVTNLSDRAWAILGITSGGRRFWRGTRLQKKGMEFARFESKMRQVFRLYKRTNSKFYIFDSNTA